MVQCWGENMWDAGGSAKGFRESQATGMHIIKQNVGAIGVHI